MFALTRFHACASGLCAGEIHNFKMSAPSVANSVRSCREYEAALCSGGRETSERSPKNSEFSRIRLLRCLTALDFILCQE